MKIITRTVWILSVVSLFTDIASEMLYPVMPVYLKEIGFSILLIGILEGVAEATAGLSKSYFGKLSDASGKRLPFVRLGYLLSAISKPMMAVFIYPLWIFLARTTDRLGKGIRTGARDALLSDEATPETKGRVFGFHRAMDTLGAVIGPASALLFLYIYPGQYKTLFFIAFIPSIVAISFTYFIKQHKISQSKISLRSASLFSFVHYWRKSSATYKKLVIGLLAFTLINSSDVFLLLKVKEAGLNDTWVIGVYIFYNFIYALAAYPLGRLSDWIGFKKTILIGFVLFATVYTGMAIVNDLYAFYGLFFLYGLYAAATESVAKAWISNIADKNDTATAIGTYTGFQSVFTMIASSLAGWIWLIFGSSATFLVSAVVAVFIVVFIAVHCPQSKIKYNQKKYYKILHNRLRSFAIINLRLTDHLFLMESGQESESEISKKQKKHLQRNESIVFGLGLIPKEGVPKIKIRYNKSKKGFLGKVTNSKDSFEFKKKIIESEAKGESWLQRNWRPLLMCIPCPVLPSPGNNP